MQHTIRSVCVFCGARSGLRASYAEAARAFGMRMGQENWRLVYGAGDVGLMGEVADAARAAGATTFGVIPQLLMARERAARDRCGLVVTETMHERKKVMFANSDAVVVLPGGAGSLDEFFEVLTWRQLGLHGKPILLLNVDGYWDPLERLLDHVIAEGFADAGLRRFITLAPDVPALVATLRHSFATAGRAGS